MTTNNEKELDVEYPYMDICADLLLSVTNAIGEVLDSSEKKESLDARINRHFCWLISYRGSYKHLVSGSPSEKIKSIVSKRLSYIWTAEKTDEAGEYKPRFKGDTKEKLLVDIDARAALLNRDSLNADNDGVRKAPTRISRIIKEATLSRFVTTKVSSPLRRNTEAVVFPSPFELTLDILSMPGNPASRSVAVFALKSVLMHASQLVPEELASGASDHRGRLTTESVINAFEYNRTSLTPRDRSKGKDPLPPNLFSNNEANRSTGLVRAILAMLGYFDIRLKPDTKYSRFVLVMEHLLSPSRTPKNASKNAAETFDYVLAENRQDLPYSGEIINLLWGIQIALRGADTLFRGGLKFSSRGGMVLAIHGSPGSGKTSLSLALGASLALYGIRTDFITTEECESDLKTRTRNILGTLARDLDASKSNVDDWLNVTHFEKSDLETIDEKASPIEVLTEDLEVLIEPLQIAYDRTILDEYVPLPCSNVVIIDGLHDTLAAMSTAKDRRGLLKFIETCRAFNALVILTIGDEMGSSLDYLVDTVVRLEHSKVTDRNSKPDRRILLEKARHQVFAPGSHGFSMSGDEGLRFTPQSSYLLESFASRRPSLPDKGLAKTFLNRSFPDRCLKFIPQSKPVPKTLTSSDVKALPVRLGVDIFQGSHIFVNGDGSAGKAAFALKIATSPWMSETRVPISSKARDRVLIISFLYPGTYYDNIVAQLDPLRKLEYPELASSFQPTDVETMHLYPGHLEPDSLFNRVLWKLEEARLQGDSFTNVIIDGIHNVFLQFPEIEARRLFFPQLFNALRSSDLTLIVTHTLLSVRSGTEAGNIALDGERSDALKHALVHKMDYSLNISPVRRYSENRSQNPNKDKSNPTHRPKWLKCEQQPFKVTVNSAIGQNLPGLEPELYWSRERLILYHDTNVVNNFGSTQGSLNF